MRVTSLEPEGTASYAEPRKTRHGGKRSSSASRAEERESVPTGGNSGSRSTIAVGKKVRIVRGLAAGVEGVIVERWSRDYGGTPQWVVASGDLVRRRVLRADYLEVVP